jgi:hypothetical protein
MATFNSTTSRRTSDCTLTARCVLAIARGLVSRVIEGFWLTVSRVDGRPNHGGFIQVDAPRTKSLDSRERVRAEHSI